MTERSDDDRALLQSDLNAVILLTENYIKPLGIKVRYVPISRVETQFGHDIKEIQKIQRHTKLAPNFRNVLYEKRLVSLKLR